jgi:hypothetical protein
VEEERKRREGVGEEVGLAFCWLHLKRTGFKEEEQVAKSNKRAIK